MIETRYIRLIRRYARLNDDGNFDELANMYTEDGVYARPTNHTAHIRGREAIRDSLSSCPPRGTRLVAASIEVDVQSSKYARARSEIVVLANGHSADPGAIAATLVGGFDDVLHLVIGQWLFSASWQRGDERVSVQALQSRRDQPSPVAPLHATTCNSAQ